MNTPDRESLRGALSHVNAGALKRAANIAAEYKAKPITSEFSAGIHYAGMMIEAAILNLLNVND